MAGTLTARLEISFPGPVLARAGVRKEVPYVVIMALRGSATTAASIDQANTAGEEFANIFYETMDKRRHVSFYIQSRLPYIADVA